MKKLTSVFLAIIMTATCFFCVPFSAYAYSGEYTIVEDLYESGNYPVFESNKFKSKPWIDSAATLVRDAMILRKERCVITLDAPLQDQDDLNDILNTIYDVATCQESSRCSIDGDYIRWQVSSCGVKYSYNRSRKSYELTFTINYYDTYEEEKAVTSAINQYLSTLDIDSMTDYELLLEFHDYVIESCEYNYDDMDNSHNYSPYGVFCNGLAVCQGYTLAFNRLCREVGIDACFVCSDPNIGCHAWSLVHLGDAYYYVDCTWDDDGGSAVGYDYFLVDYDTLRNTGYDSFSTHTIYETEHDNDYFNTRYRANTADDCYNASSKSISNCTVSLNPTSVSNTTVKYGNTVLQNGIDYTIVPSDECYARIEGLGEWAGSYSTRSLPLRNANPVQAEINPCYSGKPVLPSVVISGATQGKDFDVISTDNINIGTKDAAIVGTGKYAGACFTGFTVSPLDISLTSPVLEYTQIIYNGDTRRPNVTIDGLALDYDYTVSYNPPAKTGTGYVTLTGINNCTGSRTLTYEVLPISIADMPVSLGQTDFEYDGSEKKPVVFIKGLASGTDYTVSYINNVNVGTATAIITGTGCYCGSISVNFTIHAKPNTDNKSSSAATSTAVAKKPKKATLKKLKTSKKSITVYWKKLSSVSGYQIQYSASKSFKGAKTVTVSAKSASKKISKLKKGKRYYVRVRAFNKSNGKKTYGAWSAKKSITCK